MAQRERRAHGAAGDATSPQLEGDVTYPALAAAGQGQTRHPGCSVCDSVAATPMRHGRERERQTGTGTEIETGRKEERMRLRRQGGGADAARPREHIPGERERENGVGREAGCQG